VRLAVFVNGKERVELLGNRVTVELLAARVVRLSVPAEPVVFIFALRIVPGMALGS
jgi:hypothetical protein